MLQAQPRLFTITDGEELEAILNNLSEDDDAKIIWRSLSPWIKNHPLIQAAYDIAFKAGTLPSDSNLPFKRTGTPTPQPTQPTQDPSILTRLKNEIIEHKPQFRDS